MSHLHMASIGLQIFTFIILLSGCGGPAPSKADIVGVWGNHLGSQVIFYGDGRFLVKTLPRRFIDLEAKSKFARGIKTDEGVVSGKGTWALLSEPGQAAWVSGANWWDIQLIFNQLTGMELNGTLGTQLMYTRDGQKRSLFFWEEEEGARVTYF